MIHVSSKQILITMDATSKEHLYQPVSQAYSGQRGRPRDELLRRGEKPLGGINMELPSSPMRSAGSFSPEKSVVITSNTSASSLLDTSLNPRDSIPRQYSSPIHSQPSGNLTPSDEEDLPAVTEESLGAQPTRTPSPANNRIATGISSAEASYTGHDVSTMHDILLVECLDSNLASGEVLVSTSKVVSPAKIVRHNVDGLSTVPVTHSADTSLSKNATSTHDRSDGVVRDSGQASSVDASAVRKISKPKGRYVQSRYMQSASTKSSAPVKPAPMSAKRTAAPSKPVSASGKQPASASSAKTSARSRPVKPTSTQSSRVTQKGSRPAPTASGGPMAYTTPHQLPAEQALLRARRAMPESLFTPSLQNAATIKPNLPTKTPVPAKNTAVKPQSALRPASGSRATSSLPQVHSVTDTGPSSSPHHHSATYARAMQWAFLAAKVDHTFRSQEKAVEQQIHAVWQEVEVLQRQEANYVQQLTSVRNAEIVDSLIYSQLSSLRNVVQLLRKLQESHHNLASALTTIYHQLPSKGFTLPSDINDLSRSLEKTDSLLRNVSRKFCTPVEPSLSQVTHSLSELDDCIHEELQDVVMAKELLEKACRLQTSLTSLSIHDVQLQSDQD